MKINNLLDYLIKTFRLQDWDIELIFDRSMGSVAQTHLVFNDYMATIKLDPTKSQEEQELSLVHEIIHIILRNSQTISNDNIENEKVNEILSREIERETEKLAKGIYSLYLERN